MGNVIGETFKDYVSRQIKKRQEIHGKKTRTPEEITYLNSTLAWVKLASSVSLTQKRLDLLSETYGNSMVNNINPGKELAIKNVLFNGLTSMGSTTLSSTPNENLSSSLFLDFMSNNETTNFNQQQRTGFLGSNGAYGVGGTSFGIVPMPGIVSVDSEDLNRGSIKKSRVKIKVYNKEQFDIIDVLYLRLGYTVLLEFGNSLYWDSGGRKTNIETGESNIVPGSNKLERTGATLIDTDFFRVNDNYYDLLIKIENNRENYRGNYDAILGKISNFSWTFSNDGTYDIDLDIISIGDVIESLKVNLPPLKGIGKSDEYIDRQAVLTQLENRAANNINEFFTIYPNLEKELDKWYNNAASGDQDNPSSESVKFTLAQLPLNVIGTPSKRNYEKLILDKQRVVISNLNFNPGFTANQNDGFGSGTISVSNVPQGNDIGVELLEKQQLEFLLKESIKFAIISKINGFYGGSGFRNPYSFLYTPKGKKDRENLAAKLNKDVDKLTDSDFRSIENPKYAGLDPLSKQTVDLYHQNFISLSNNYSKDGGKTTQGLVGLNFMPSNVKTIKGFNQGYQPSATDERTLRFYSNISGKEINNATFNVQPLIPTFGNQGAGIPAKDFRDAQPFATTLNAKITPPNINFNNPYKSTSTATGNRVFQQTKEEYFLDPYYRHASLFYLLWNSQGKSIGKFDDSVISQTGNYQSLNLRKNAQQQLFKNLDIIEFKQLVFKFFKLMNAAGGPNDNQFKEDPTFASYSQELEYEKNKDRIHSWFYRVRKYYTGITSNTIDLYDITNAQGETLTELKPGQVFGPITVNGDNSGNGKIKIGKILNPFDISINFKNETSDNQKAIADKWNNIVGYPNYNAKSGTIDFFVLDSFKKEVGGSGDFNLSGDGRFKYFVKLKILLEFVEDIIIPDVLANNSSKSPLLKIDTDSNSNICYTIDNVISTDIKKCIVRNDKFTCYKDYIVNTNKLFEGIDYFIGENRDKTQIYGRPMNIYLNFEFVQNLIDDIKGKTGNAVLFDFLKNICDGINSSLGNINNLEPIIDQSTNTIKIIDQTPIPNLPSILSSLKDDNGNKAYPNFTPNKPAVLELYGYNPKNNTSNFVNNVGLTTTISKRYASMITIGATANGSTPGMEATAFSNWNQGVIDRIKPEIIDGEDIDKEISLKAQNEAVIKKYQSFLSVNGEGEQFKLLGLSADGSFNDIYMSNNPSSVSDYYNYAQSVSSQSGSLESSIGFLPFNLKIDMEGISGMKIYNRLNVDTRFLPSNYPETLDFIITKVNHSLKNNVWKTTLDTQATKIIEDKKDNIRIIDTRNFIEERYERQFDDYTQDQRDAAVTPPEEYTGINGDEKQLLSKFNISLKNLAEIGYSSLKLEPEAAKWFIIMWKDMKKAGLSPKITDAFRTYETQYRILDIDLFIATGGSKTNRYGSGVKRKKKGTNGGVAVAYPGTSNHGWGIAVDIGGEKSKQNREVRCWIKENGVKYGWSWYEGRGAKEDWHFTYIPSLKKVDKELPPTPVNQVWSQAFKGNSCNFKSRLIPAKEIKNEAMRNLINGGGSSTKTILSGANIGKNIVDKAISKYL